MPPPGVRPTKFTQTHWLRRRTLHGLLIIFVFVLGLLIDGCALKGDNANSTRPASASNSNGNSNAEVNAQKKQPTALNIKEPDRYSVSVTITAQVAADNPAKMPTLQFNLTRLDADRRWAFALPAPMGQVVYLEKSGLKYLMLMDRKQYLEVSSAEFGFPVDRFFTPSALADQVKEIAQFDNLGVEPVNGRTAVKHRFFGADKNREAIDGVIYVDMETGLPVRSELNATIKGSRLRMMIESRDLQLNPDRAQFDVPAGLKKITTQEAGQQIQSVASTLRFFADSILGSSPGSPADAKQSAANRNASGR